MENIKTNLIVSFYCDKNENRQKENEYCLKKNLLAGFDSVKILIEEKDSYLCSQIKLSKNQEIFLVKKRPTFNDFFEFTNSEQINIICNSDIFFNDLSEIKNIFREKNSKICLALSRWDVCENGESILFDRVDSQDTWIFYDKVNFRTSIEFTMGLAGCDNRIAYELSEYGYELQNPSKTIKTYHYHLSNIRNILDETTGEVKDIYRVPPPYKLITPTY